MHERNGSNNEYLEEYPMSISETIYASTVDILRAIGYVETGKYRPRGFEKLTYPFTLRRPKQRIISWFDTSNREVYGEEFQELLHKFFAAKHEPSVTILAERTDVMKDPQVTITLSQKTQIDDPSSYTDTLRVTYPPNDYAIFEAPHAHTREYFEQFIHTTHYKPLRYLSRFLESTRYKIAKNTSIFIPDLKPIGEDMFTGREKVLWERL